MKKALSAVLAVVLVLGVCFSVPMIASGADTEDLTFVLNDAGTGYIVTDCDVDANGELVIPEKYAPEVNIADPVNANEAGGEATTYNVVIDDTLEKVTLSVDKATATVNDTVTVTVVSVVDGYELTGIVVTDSAKASVEVTKVSDTEYTFVMPESNVDVTATYQEKVVVPETYTITGVTAIGGKVEANVTSAKVGDKVTLTVTETAGYELKADTLKVNGGAVVLAEDKSFIMPAGNVTITAEFEKIVYTVAITDVGEIVGIHTDKTTTGATVGDIVTVQVTVAEKYVLDDLIIKDAAGEDVEFTPVENEAGKYTFTMPASNVTITATYAHEELRVVGIADGAFEGCTKLTKITIGKNVTTIGEEAFKGCTKLEAFDVAAGNTAFAVDNAGVLYNFAKTKLIAAPYILGDADVTTEQSLIIPATVEVIAKGAFQTLGELDYVFGGNANLTVEENNEVLTATVLHKGMTSHTEDDGTTTDATCMQKGETVYKCKVCAKLMSTEEIDIVTTAHNMSDWETVTPATCTQEGVERQVCTNKDADGNSCTHYKTDIINKLQHVKSEKGVVTTQAKCGEKGVETFYCKTCDYVFETKDIDALEHKITEDGTNNNVSAKTEATCTEDGSITGNCDHCGNLVTLTIKAKGHENIRVVDAEVTCTVDGWEHYECKNCGEYLKGSDKKLDAPGHIAASVKDENDNFVDYKWTVVKAPTCSEDGFAEVRCENCGIQMVDPEGEIEYTRVLPATGKHDFKDYTETKAATCEEEGEKTGTCACGATDVQKIDALGHDVKDVEFTVDLEATCKDNGSKSKHCKRCDEKLEVTVITEKGAHKLAEGATTTTPATCYIEGVMTGTCTVCGSTTATVAIPTLEHKWAETAVNLKAPIVGTIQATNEDGTPKVDEDGKPVMVPYTYEAPTCEDEGYQAIYCTNQGCPTSIIKEGSLVKVDALGHDYDDTYNTDIPANKAATCKEAGYMFKWCKTCSEANKANENKGYVKIELAKKDHEWKTAAENLRAPITIQVAKEVDGKIELGKDGKPVMVDKQVSAPTCEKTGYTAIYCENYATCGEIKDVTEVAARGHLYDEAKWVKVSDATCMAKEIQSNTCLRTDCDDPDKTQTREYGDFAAHNYATTYTYEYQTCEKDGRKYYACTTKLGDKQCEAVSGVEVLPALGHKFAEGAKFNVITEVGCEVNGEKVMECLNSFHKVTKEPYTETTNSGTTGDSNASGNGGTTPAPATEGNGTEGGTTTTTRPAAPNGYEYCAGYTVITPATGHAFSDEYTEDTAATCEKEGSESRHCTNEGCKVTTGSRAIAKLGHNYSTEYKTVTPATCQAEGQEARYCLNKDCKSYTGERRLAKTSHSYDEANGWVVDTRATCTTKGSKHVDCKVCGAAGRKTAEIAALGHDISNATLITDPATCLADGETYKLCERIVATTGEGGAVTYAPCNEKVVIEELKATGHNVTTWNTEADPATCTDAGTKTGTCTNERCPNTGKQVTETVPALGHQYSTEPTRTEPTCYKEGKLVGTCTRPGCTAETGKAEQILPMIDHTWGDWEMNIDPATEKAYDDCTKTGSLIRKCTVKACGASDEPTENKTHTESGWILDSDATCSTNGGMHTECTVCKSEIKTQTLYATNAHDYEEDLEERVEPTCNTAGSKTLVCKNCAKVTKETIAPTDHTFTDWKVFVEPTCTEKGIRQSVCTVCLTTKSEKILANGHTESDWIVTEPTCTQTGEKHTECTVCKEVIKTETIDALGHNYTTSNTCSAKDCDAQLYEYKLIGESKTDIEITKYNPDSKNVVKNVVIPSEIDGYVVKAIGDRAFMNIEEVLGAIINEETGERAQTTTRCVKSAIETVTIPETVTTIGDYAFATASDNFKSVVIPGTVTTIGDYAFGYNVELNWIPDAEAEVEVGETRPLIESTPLVKSRVADFAIYGVKDSAAAVYAAQKADDTTDDFKFAAIADIYEVAIPEEFTEVAEKSSDNVVLFKDFVEYAADATNKKSIAEQIAAVVDINVSGYSVEVVSSQSYEPVDKDGNVIEEDCKYFYGTGTKVLVKEGNNVVDVIEIVVQGDVNGDGAVDAIDCMLVQLASQNQKALDGVYLTAGDYNYDGKVEVADFSGVVNRVFGTDVIIGEEETTTPSTSAPTTTEPTTEAPAESTTQAPAESTTQAPAESTTQAPAESTTQTPAESTTQTPAESTTQTSGEAA